MRHVKMLGGCLLACCALCALAASGASAALPELGRCKAVPKTQEEGQKHATYHGDYTSAGCTHFSPKKHGAYEWTSGAATSTLEERAEPVIFKTSGGEEYECDDGKFLGGEITGPKTEKFTGIELSNCGTDAEKYYCWTNAAKGPALEDPAPAEAELGFISGGKKATVGWEFKKLRFAFFCGELPTFESEHVLEGSVIAIVKHPDVMERSTELAFRQKGGRQVPQGFEGGEATKLMMTSLAGTEKHEEPTLLLGAAESQYKEALEIRTKGASPAAKEEEEAAAKKKAEEEAAAKKKAEEEAAAKKKAEEELAAAKRAAEEAAETEKHDEETAAAKKALEEAAEQKKHEEEAFAAKKAAEEAAESKKHEEELAATAQKEKQAAERAAEEAGAKALEEALEKKKAEEEEALRELIAGA